MDVSQLHWAQMNCPLNPNATDGTDLYCSEAPPPDYILPKGYICDIYHPTTMDDRPGLPLSADIQERIMDFIRTHDVTESGNVTELSHDNFTRFLAVPTIIAVILHDDNIIGTMFTLPLRVSHKNHTLISSYTTFLCVSRQERENGMAMVLIRAVMQFGYDWYGINHGYYMTAVPHHPIHSPLKSWYRPINVKQAKAAGFALQPFATVERERMAYHVGKPRILPVKVGARDYHMVVPLLSNGELCLAPTLKEWSQLCECFDTYVVPGKGLFLLFPLRAHITEKHKVVQIAQLALMIGDVLPQALWIASVQHYDLLYGRYCGNITVARVAQIRGQTTASSESVEYYNTRVLISNQELMLPVF